MKNSFKSVLKYLVYPLLLTACSVSKQAVSEEEQFAAMYNPSEYSLNVEYKLYHLSDELSSLYIRMNPAELLFNQANTDGELRAIVQIYYSLFELDENDEIVATADSGQMNYVLTKEDKDKTVFFKTKVLQIPAGKKYLMRLDSKDMHRGTIGLRHIYVDKLNVYSSQNFNVLSARYNFPRFFNYFSTGELFRLIYRQPGIDTLYIDYSARESDIPRPQILEDSKTDFEFKADTNFIIIFNDSTILSLPEEGAYHIRIDTTINTGISLYNFGNDFPRINSEESMLDPIFYLATMTEFKQLKSRENVKRAVDDFWLQLTKSPDKSRELIRIYYNRVLYSNLFFTTNREGWKTDRGMLFILFGPPDRIKDSGNEERWYYILGKQGRVQEFVFKRKVDPYANQVLIWQKNNESMTRWSTAVSTWRSGKPYSLGK